MLVDRKEAETEQLYATGSASPILKRETSIETSDGDNEDLDHCLRETHTMDFIINGSDSHEFLRHPPLERTN